MPAIRWTAPKRRAFLTTLSITGASRRLRERGRIPERDRQYINHELHPLDYNANPDIGSDAGP